VALRWIGDAMRTVLQLVGSMDQNDVLFADHRLIFTSLYWSIVIGGTLAARCRYEELAVVLVATEEQEENWASPLNLPRSCMSRDRVLGRRNLVGAATIKEIKREKGERGWTRVESGNGGRLRNGREAEYCVNNWT
jgi:hypothetical protein